MCLLSRSDPLLRRQRKNEPFFRLRIAILLGKTGTRIKKIQEKRTLKILPNLQTVDSDRANFPLHGGKRDFLVQSNEPKND